MGDLCSATQGKRYQVFSTHPAALAGSRADMDISAHTFSQPGEEAAWEVNPIYSETTDQKVSCTTPHPCRFLSRPDVCASFAHRSVHFALPLERIMAFRWGDYVEVEGSDWTDNFNLAKNGNPIQREEEQIIPCSSVLCQVWGFQIFPSHFMPLCF